MTILFKKKTIFLPIFPHGICAAYYIFTFEGICVEWPPFPLLELSSSRLETVCFICVCVCVCFLITVFPVSKRVSGLEKITINNTITINNC